VSERTGQGDLIKLSDSDRTLKDPSQDLRGKDAYDPNGEQIGTVENLYMDRQTEEVRYLGVGAGGFLGMGEKHFLIPLEAIDDVSDDRVTLNQDREKITGSPDYDPDAAPTSDYQRGLYDYYGYAYPGWAYW
jgi:sporulation protein YlmC with PRC-barrel domain